MPKKKLRFDRFGCGAVAGQMVQNLQQQQKLAQPVGVVETGVNSMMRDTCQMNWILSINNILSIVTALKSALVTCWASLMIHLVNQAFV